MNSISQPLELSSMIYFHSRKSIKKISLQVKFKKKEKCVIEQFIDLDKDLLSK
jgi:hypothetical protein